MLTKPPNTTRRHWPGLALAAVLAATGLATAAHARQDSGAAAPSWGPTLDPAVPAVRAADKARPKPKVPPRRAVQQVLTPTPGILGSAAVSATPPPLTYGPRLDPGGAGPAAATAPRQRGTVPATCTAAGCTDASGARLGTGVGAAAVTPQGQLCTRTLVGVQCF
ncbi:hypothetical protein [Massilia sp. DWR3-1-1]|uniref:hypothetical protein n=1 Tax=Massilia sp. DWR3-1-1 TaxID=2804559 RepID=UPI003CF2B90C